MAGGYKSIFYIILSTTIIWFIIIFLCLPQIDDDTNSLPLTQQQQLTWTLPFQTRDEQSAHSRGYDSLGDTEARGESILSPKSFNYMKYFHKYDSKTNKKIGINDILFYEFNANPNKTDFNNYDHSSTTSSKKQHESDTSKLGIINNSIDKYVKTEGYNLFAFNLLVSNRIGLFRSIPDTRNQKCPRKLPQHYDSSQPKVTTTLKANYSSEKDSTISKFHPQAITSNYVINESNSATSINLKASIVICYYNEAPSALLRTLFTIIKRSPLELIEEIIVIDDYSEQEFSYEKIIPFISNLNFIKTIRTTKREGLIRARLFGANLTKGDVLIFLDSHVEANIGWLEPLLETIQLNRTTIACPMIDLINHETLIYSSSPMVKGGFNWALNFKWDSVPSDQLKTYDDFIRPIESPTLAGGLYAIRRDYFFELGSYDSGMNLWGGENVELSFRAWMCGGRIVILPCSRMGHIFRKRRPYGPKPNEPDSLLYNSHRTARVWLNEEKYMLKFYEMNPNARDLQSGDISQRIDIKKRLNCQNFTWYLDNIYPKLNNKISVESSSLTYLNENNIPNSFKSKEQYLNQANNNVHKSYGYSRWNNLHQNTIGNNRLQREVSYKNENIRSQQFRNRKPIFIDTVNSNYSSQEMNNNPTLDNILKHKSRSNYIDNSIPKIINQFQIQSINSNLCIESRTSYLTKSFKRLILNECAKVNLSKEGELLLEENKILVNQLWSETEFHDYRLGDNQCLDLIKNLPLARKCHNMGSFQDWKYNTNATYNTNIYNADGNLCLGVERVQVGEPIIVIICDKDDSSNNDDKSSIREPHHSDGIVDELSLGNNNQYSHNKNRNKKTYLPSRKNRSQYQHHLVETLVKSGSFRPSQRWNLIYLRTNKTTNI